MAEHAPAPTALDEEAPHEQRTHSPADQAREAAVEAALGKLDLDAKARLLAGQDMWSLPALPEIGLGPWSCPTARSGSAACAGPPTTRPIALPSPTALAAAWDPALARRAGRLLAQEARRKGVHVLLAPTVNLHRSPARRPALRVPTARTRT